MGDPVQKDTRLYQTPHGTVFHVEPVPAGKTREQRVCGVQRRQKQLRWQAHYLAEQSFQIARVEFCGRIIHKQGGDARAELRVASQLTKEQRRGGQLLLPARYSITGGNVLESDPDVCPVRPRMREAALAIPLPRRFNGCRKASVCGPALMQGELQPTTQQTLSGS